MKNEQTSKCAHCGKQITFTPEIKKLWPFCSKRCKIIDLGKWLGEKYVVQEEATEQDLKKDTKVGESDE